MMMMMMIVFGGVVVVIICQCLAFAHPQKSHIFFFVERVTELTG